MAKKLGHDKAKEIRENPDLFYNHERFRIWHAKARFRATLSTIIAVPAISTVLNGNRNGVTFMTRNWFLTIPLALGVWSSSYFVFNRLGGYTN